MGADNGPLSPFTTPLGNLEVNAFIAGLEASVGGWIVYAIISGTSLLPSLPAQWSWHFAVFALILFVGLFLAGLAIEGLAGVATIFVTQRRDGTLRPWYNRKVKPPKDWGAGQRWMWKSPQAAAEFGRRRTRILVSRNTAFNFALFGFLLLIALPIFRPAAWIWVMLGDLFISTAGVLLFGWVWLSAHEAWNKAVQDAGDIGAP